MGSVVLLDAFLMCTKIRVAARFRAGPLFVRNQTTRGPCCLECLDFAGNTCDLRDLPAWKN